MFAVFSLLRGVYFDYWYGGFADSIAGLFVLAGF